MLGHSPEMALARLEKIAATINRLCRLKVRRVQSAKIS